MQVTLLYVKMQNVNSTEHKIRFFPLWREGLSLNMPAYSVRCLLVAFLESSSTWAHNEFVNILCGEHNSLSLTALLLTTLYGGKGSIIIKFEVWTVEMWKVEVWKVEVCFE